MMFVQSDPISNRQLTLDFSDGPAETDQSLAIRNVTRTIVFPKHIHIPNFGRFQRQVNFLFAPLGISVEFRLTRQKRLEMKWIFPSEAQVSSLSKQKNGMPFRAVATELSVEEVKAFESVVFALAGTH